VAAYQRGKEINFWLISGKKAKNEISASGYRPSSLLTRSFQDDNNGKGFQGGEFLILNS
jgi:hypothetical protein